MVTDRDGPSTPNFFIPPTFPWAERVTGRNGWQPSYEQLAFGMYVKRARFLARCTQTRLEKLSGVDQGRISRLERGLSPTTRVEHLVPIAAALGRAFPLGYCPHEHWCEWQPAPPAPPERDWLAEAKEFNARHRIVPEGGADEHRNAPDDDEAGESWLATLR